MSAVLGEWPSEFVTGRSISTLPNSINNNQSENRNRSGGVSRGGKLNNCRGGRGGRGGTGNGCGRDKDRDIGRDRGRDRARDRDREEDSNRGGRRGRQDWSPFSSSSSYLSSSIPLSSLSSSSLLPQCSLLHELITQHNEASPELLASSSSSFEKEQDGERPLHLAARLGKVSWVEFLITNGVDLNSRTLKGKHTALHLACWEKQGEAVSQLLSAKANICLLNADGLTALKIALQDSSPSSVSSIPSLTSSSSSVSSSSSDTSNIVSLLTNSTSLLPFYPSSIFQHQLVLTLANICQTGTRFELEKLKLASPALFLRTITEGPLPRLPAKLNVSPLSSCLDIAVELGNVDVAVALVEAGAKVNGDYFDNNRVVSCQEPPIHRAARTGQDKVLLTLLKKCQADVNQLSEQNLKKGIRDTPLHVASREGQLKSVQLLLTNEADVCASNYWGNTPLHLAAGKGFFSIAKLLINSGGTLDALNKKNETPLNYAVRYHSVMVTQLLLYHGADKSLPNNEGKMVLQLVKEELEVCKYQTTEKRREVQQILKLLEQDSWEMPDESSLSDYQTLKAEVERLRTENQKLHEKEEEEAERRSCVICCDEDKNGVFVPCGHIATCFGCASHLFAQGLTCPCCRGPLSCVLQTFLA